MTRALAGHKEIEAFITARATEYGATAQQVDVMLNQHATPW